MNLVTDHKVNDKLIRTKTPFSQIRRSAIPSPSRLTDDQLLLPNMSRNRELLPKTTSEDSKNDSNNKNEPEHNPYLIENIKLGEDFKRM